MSTSSNIVVCAFLSHRIRHASPPCHGDLTPHEADQEVDHFAPRERILGCSARISSQVPAATAHAIHSCIDSNHCRFLYPHPQTWEVKSENTLNRETEIKYLEIEFCTVSNVTASYCNPHCKRLSSALLLCRCLCQLRPSRSPTSTVSARRMASVRSRPDLQEPCPSPQVRMYR